MYAIGTPGKLVDYGCPVDPIAPTKLERRIVTAAEAKLARSKVVTPVDVLVGIGWIPPNSIDRWQQARIDHLAAAATVTPEKLAAAVEIVSRWAQSRGLVASEASYLAATRDREQLRFTATGDPLLERGFRQQWFAPDLPEAKRAQLDKAPDLVVVEAQGDWTCVECEGSGELLIMERGSTLCLECADLDHLVFLPSGDATLSRRAKKASGLAAVVMRLDKRRNRHRRLGILVEQAALEQAEEQCFADEEVRARRRVRDGERRVVQDVEFQGALATSIRSLFPGCPAERAEAIAAHTGVRGSGRVGRSAAGRELDEKAVTRAVVASVRHEDTDYDAMLMTGVPRDEARLRIRDRITEVLTSWSP